MPKIWKHHPSTYLSTALQLYYCFYYITVELNVPIAPKLITIIRFIHRIISVSLLGIHWPAVCFLWTQQLCMWWVAVVYDNPHMLTSWKTPHLLWLTCLTDSLLSSIEWHPLHTFTNTYTIIICSLSVPCVKDLKLEHSMWIKSMKHAFHEAISDGMLSKARTMNTVVFITFNL